MELKQSLSLRLSQSLVMTPQLQLAIKLLQLNRLELQDLVHQEILENPMLEEKAENETAAEETAPADIDHTVATQPAQRDEQAAAEEHVGEGKEPSGLDIPWESMAESYAYQPPGSNMRAGMDELPGYDQTLTRAETLHEHLLWQLSMLDVHELERDIGQRIIGDIDEHGYLKGGSVVVDEPSADPIGAEVRAVVEVAKDLGLHDELEPTLIGDVLAHPDLVSADLATLAVDDEPEHDEALVGGNGKDVAAQAMPEAPSGAAILQAIADDLEVPVEWVENVRQQILRFDPLGVGALDLRECLLIQLDVGGYDDNDLPFLMVRDHLKEIENRNFKVITKKLKVTMEEVGEALKIIQALEPKPGRSYTEGNGEPETQYITPDIYVQKVGEEYAIILNEDGLPKLRISRFYRNQLKEAASRGETKSYIRDKLRSATWLIRSIHQRQRTVYRVMESILKFQRDFFDRGVAHLKPMVLQDVARDIGMHESTISRVKRSKYVHTPHGIFELGYFFNSSIHRTEGEDIASESVKEAIRHILTGEDPKKPLSDAQIVTLLRGQKIDIARRTVAKYREMMGILPSSKRRQIF